MTASKLSKTLMSAWRKDNQGLVYELQEPGEHTAEVISAALSQEKVQEMLRHALSEGLDPRHATLINQEAERQAGLWLWDPEDAGKMDRECILLAFPATGDLKALETWLSTPDNCRLLETLTQNHLGLLTGLATESVDCVSVFPTLLHPAFVASLTAEFRRKSLMEILGRGDGQLLLHLESQKIDLESMTEEKVLGEAVVLVAAVVRTNWGWHQPSTAQGESESHRIDALAMGDIDEDFMIQSQLVWEESIRTLQVAGPSALRQPTSMNQALLATLRSSLTNIRKYALSAADPSLPIEEWESEENGEFSSILQLSIQEGDPEHILLDIKTLHAQTIVQLPVSWAFIEGEEPFRKLLVETMDLDEHSWQSESEVDLEQRRPSFRDAEGDHPAWKHAMPAPGSTH